MADNPHTDPTRPDPVLEFLNEHVRLSTPVTETTLLEAVRRLVDEVHATRARAEKAEAAELFLRQAGVALFAQGGR
jgi:hypothetical protein